MASSPFHSLGFIGPQHKAPWAAMRRYDEILTEVVDDLRQSPAEYVLVRAPILSGKTTYGYQLMERVSERHPEILVVYLDLGGLGTDPMESQIVHRVQNAIRDRLTDLIHADSLGEWQENAARGTVSSLEIGGFGDLNEMLRSVLQSLDAFERVVLVIDGIGSLRDDLHEAFQERLRAIHANRSAGPLKRFSMVILAESLHRQQGNVSPLSNVVKRYALKDFTEDEFRTFIRRCEESLGGLTFDGKAADYLFEKTGGHMVMVQKILEAATKSKIAPTHVEIKDILEGIALCYEERGGVVPRLLGRADTINDEARNRLGDILRGNSVLHHEAFADVAQLVDAGIVKEGAHGRSVCRSPLLREFLLKKYMNTHALPVLTKTEQGLATLPQVLFVLINDPLLAKVRDAVADASQGPSSTERESKLEALVLGVLEEEGLDMDEEAIRFFFNRYFPDDSAQEVGRETVLRLMAKVYLNWCTEEMLP